MYHITNSVFIFQKPWPYVSVEIVFTHISKCKYKMTNSTLCVVMFLSTDYAQIRSYTWLINEAPGVKNSKCCLIGMFKKCVVKGFKLQLLGHTVSGAGMSSKVVRKGEGTQQNDLVIDIKNGDAQ